MAARPHASSHFTHRQTIARERTFKHFDCDWDRDRDRVISLPGRLVNNTRGTFAKLLLQR